MSINEKAFEAAIVALTDEQEIDKWTQVWEARLFLRAYLKGAKASQQYRMPDGRPIFGEDSPHDIADHLEKICAEQSVMQTKTLIADEKENVWRDDIWEPIRVRLLEQESGWQPIETAPKDGTWVLLSGGITSEDDYMNTGVEKNRPATGFYRGMGQDMSADDSWCAPDIEQWNICFWDGDYVSRVVTIDLPEIRFEG